MASKDKLTLRIDRAARLMREKKIRAPAAARRVLLSENITYPPDVKRLVSDICSGLSKRGHAVKRSNKRKKRSVVPSLYRPPTQLDLPLW